MKKLLGRALGSIAISIMSIGVLIGCSNNGAQEPISIATLNGPTGIGMIKLIEKQEEASDYQIDIYQSPDEIVGKVVSGELDVACVPSNLAAVLYNKTEGGIRLLGTNTLGVLYIVENGSSIASVEDLKGKTIYASGKGSTPDFILNHVLKSNGIDSEKNVKIEYLANHADIASQVMANEGSVALLPQPFVTTVTEKSDAVNVVLDLNELWYESEQMDLPMGVIIASEDFVTNNPKGVKTFLKDYEESVQYVAENLDEAAKLVAEFGLVPSEEIAKLAIPKCNIIFRDAGESKESLDAFYNILFKNDPKAVGGKLPDASFYDAK